MFNLLSEDERNQIENDLIKEYRYRDLSRTGLSKLQGGGDYLTNSGDRAKVTGMKKRFLNQSYLIWKSRWIRGATVGKKNFAMTIESRLSGSVAVQSITNR
ncbi:MULTISPECIES: hypothetical protein [Paenibacillus]|uniref:hypothetical protein n=1 Tax=Paenibacillus TaxID=44249 RepID=UPI002DBB0DA8|nr:hypothetical protein [Paenibacillus odorifer]MEC0134341.1 hypothetical protein [Paenibacillus odorifer]MEC0222933.1 hypothetical protein [Paenibacillus odorifer]